MTTYGLFAVSVFYIVVAIFAAVIAFVFVAVGGGVFHSGSAEYFDCYCYCRSFCCICCHLLLLLLVVVVVVVVVLLLLCVAA